MNTQYPARLRLKTGEGKDRRGQENSILLHEFKSEADYRTGNSEAQQNGDLFKVQLNTG